MISGKKTRKKKKKTVRKKKTEAATEAKTKNNNQKKKTRMAALVLKKGVVKSILNFTLRKRNWAQQATTARKTHGCVRLPRRAQAHGNLAQ